MILYPNDYPSTAVEHSIRNVLALIEQLRNRAAEVMNFNRVRYVSQAAEPTPDDGTLTVWKDSDAASGQPSHYLIYRDGATNVKWTSSTLVP